MDVSGPAHGPAFAAAAAEAARVASEAIDGLAITPATPHGIEAAVVQTGPSGPARARESATTAQAPPQAPEARGDAALPAAQLVSATLVSLTVDPETWWLLQRDPDTRRETEPDAEAEAEHADWREALALAVHSALSAADPPAAVQSVDEEWRRGRRVVLACPRGPHPGSAAWIYVTGEPLLSPDGVRLAARIRWFDVAAPDEWRHARLEKSYHPLCGRYLGIPEAAGSRLPCTIQFGPTLPLWRSDVCVRIDAAGSFWDALGVQWSVLLAVSATPLERTR